MQRPTTIAISGFTSEVGKTTLMCDLLAALPVGRRSRRPVDTIVPAGRSTHVLCQHLLTDEPVIRSGREATYSVGKDHLAVIGMRVQPTFIGFIVTEEQVEEGINERWSASRPRES